MTSTSNTIAECNWVKIPTKDECLKLMQLDLFCLDPYYLEYEGQFNLNNTCITSLNDQAWKELKQTVIDSINLDPWKYSCPILAEGPLTKDQEILNQSISTCQTMVYGTIHTQFWRDLCASGISDQGWEQMWRKVDITQIFTINWLLHLLAQKEEKQRQERERAYNEAGYLSRIVGWY